MEDSQVSMTATERTEVVHSGPKTFPAPTPLHQAFESGRYPYARLMGRVG